MKKKIYCRDCAYFDALPEIYDSVEKKSYIYGLCRKKPPKCDNAGNGVFPKILNMNWCGGASPKILYE